MGFLSKWTVVIYAENRGADPRARRAGVPLAGRTNDERSRVKWLVPAQGAGTGHLTKSAPGTFGMRGWKKLAMALETIKK